MNAYVILNWMLLIGLLPLSFFWLRKAWKIGIKNDMSYVALKSGVSPDNPEKYAKYTIAINLICGLVLVVIFLLVFIIALPYEIWTATVGPTIWMKFIFDFILNRHAHKKIK